jgi:hypothetical protein
MGFACLLTKATDTHSEYLIYIVLVGNIVYANIHQYYA